MEYRQCENCDRVFEVGKYGGPQKCPGCRSKNTHYLRGGVVQCSCGKKTDIFISKNRIYTQSHYYTPRRGIQPYTRVGSRTIAEEDMWTTY